MEGKNIEKMNEYIAKIFEKLYSEFPNPTYIESSTVTGLPSVDFNDWDAFREFKTNKDTELFISTAAYLFNEGYIRSSQLESDGKPCDPLNWNVATLTNTVLTEKALQVLSARPKALQGKSIIDISRTFKEEGIKAASKELVSALAQAGISLVDRKLKIRDNE
ncbi:hypothetical protein [Pseudoalteromonas umbrosa]|uniref:hypothetical protein n=1 Tax=Pseudoalteromonas umbrosa TaxID=3048489 RepID=UPI0024C25745|nr:hypothetical protein [Pseudoalteromonas sp. B95]MDK1289806.1 hypothetical protein [Pseudoalteromonas sp. B95]